MTVFDRPTHYKTCLNCPTPFETKNPAAKYCDVCRPLMKLEMSRIAGAKKRAADRARWRSEYRNTTPPAQPAVRRLPITRARSLAETPDVPCDTAARGDMLTGAAPAANYGASVGMISVGV